VSSTSTHLEPSPSERDERHAAGDGVRSRLVGAGRLFTVIAGLVLAIAALKLGKPVLLPLVAGIFLAIVVQPIHRRLGAVLPWRFRWLALVVAMLTVLAGIAAFGGALTVSGRAVADELQARRPEIESQLARVRALAARVGLEIPGGSASPGESQQAQSAAQGGAQGGRA
jgi:predicted PurR-regulated permease PerM